MVNCSPAALGFHALPIESSYVSARIGGTHLSSVDVWRKTCINNNNQKFSINLNYVLNFTGLLSLCGRIVGNYTWPSVADYKSIRVNGTNVYFQMHCTVVKCVELSDWLGLVTRIIVRIERDQKRRAYRAKLVTDIDAC